MSHYRDRIAKSTGLGRTFLGIILFSTVTSLPELPVCVTYTSVVQAPHLAIGNVFGSNIFNLAIIPVADIFLVKGPILANASQNHILTAVLGIVMTNIVIRDLIYGAKEVRWRGGWGSISIINLYFLGSITLFTFGIR